MPGRGPARAPRRGWIGWLSATLTLALFITLAVVAGGFDARDTPREEAGVWVTRAAGQYARVNTVTAQIDTVRQVENPSGVVQSGQASLLLTQGHARAWVIDPAAPLDVGAEREDAAGQGSAAGEADAIRTPTGTSQALAAGDTVLFHTDSGQAYLAGLDAAASANLGEAQLLDPLGAEADASYRADAVALEGSAGLVALFSASEHAVRWYDAAAGAFRAGVSPVPEAVPGEGVQLAIVAGEWVLFDPETGALWRESRAEPVQLEPRGVARLQASSGDAAGAEALVADEAGLWRVDRTGETRRVVEAEGTPAQPIAIGSERVAAWLGQAGGELWTPSGGLTPLEADPAVELPGERAPVIHSNGSRAVLAETGTGMMWRVPDGKLIPVEQWQLVTPPQQEAGAVVTADVAEQQPPVAVSDAFGVRPGEPTPLPVLLNDFDPNRRDVLTVVPEGLGEGLDSAFGTVGLLSDGQGLTVRPSANAAGTASFSYRVTDGQQVSPAATVTLTVADDAVNTAPAWCPVDGCQRDWPSPELTPGGTLVLPLLEGWVDAEGDPMVLAEAAPVNATDPVRVLVTAEGKLAVRHTDPAAADAEVPVGVVVEDSRGARQERELRLQVRSGATLALHPLASTVRVGEPTVLRPLERATGGSGAFELLDASVQQGAVGLDTHLGQGTLTVTASGAGGALLSVTVRDVVTGQEATGAIRLTAVDERSALAVPPLRAFVRPLADTTVEVLAAVPGAASRGLSVRSAAVRDGQLRADVIEHARIRVSGATADGAPGRIGAVDVAVTEGDAVAQTRLTVFQVPASGGGAIAVADTATVRAGSVVDIPVLDNDVAPPGERLVLHPEVAGASETGDLAFASGGLVRYLAPSTPGTYTLTYTTYGASSPELSDTGQVTVTVLPAGANRNPQPQTVTVRLAPGESVSATVPLSGVDPDGDRVRLIAVQEPEDTQVVATMLPRTGDVRVEAAENAASGTRMTTYVVRDGLGGEAAGRLRIIVTEPDEGAGAPVAYSDYVRIARGTAEPATVRPLDNDLDPAGGALELVSVVPNVPGGEAADAFADLAERLDTSRLGEGIVRIAGGDALETVSYRYTVRSRTTDSTADGLIVVQVSERVGAQAPTITDTVLSVRDRADFASVGVDVVDGRVRWAAGDTSTLRLSLWGTAAEQYRVSGNAIIGDYRAQGDLVPFRLTGLDHTGAEVVSYGFLVIPPLDELRLSLRPGVAPLAVNEGDSVDAQLRDLLDLAPGDRIEVAPGPFTTQRAQAGCLAVGETAVRYTAGSGEPWADTCTVQVRLAEQTSYSSVPIPVRIMPNEPVAELRPLTRTVAPGDSDTIALGSMVVWQGGRAGQMGALRFAVTGGAPSFEVTQAGATVTVQAKSGAVPGTQETLTVSVEGAGASQATLTLRVGEAAVDAPRGAVVALSCTVGSPCSAPLVGQPGEYDPFAGKPGAGLSLVSIDAAACQFGTLRVEGGSVTVSWADPRAAGGTCQVPFTVRDAQNRQGTGSLSFEALGVPRAPALVEQTGFTASTVTLRVTLGDAQLAYPALGGVTIAQDGAPAGVTCTPAGTHYTCEVGGLRLGEIHQFTATAFNAVGDSAPSAAAPAWAYRPPATPTVTLRQTAAEAGGEFGSVRIEITGGADAKEHQVLLDGAALQTVPGATATATLRVPVGPHRVSVLPVSVFPHPLNEPNTGSASPAQDLTVAGLPQLRDVTLASEPGSTEVTVTIDLFANWGEGLRYGVTEQGACAVNTQWPDSGGPVTVTRTGVPGDTMEVTVCAANDWGAATQITRDIVVGGT